MAAAPITKPILTITSDNFLTGISPRAHGTQNGLFFSADGITPLIEPGVDQSKYNGLLIAGSEPTTISGTLTGKIIGATKDLQSSSTAYFVTSDGKLWDLTLDTSFGSALGSIHSGISATGGLEWFAGYLYYRQQGQMGRYDGTTFTDAWKGSADGMNTDYIGATHVSDSTLYFGNGYGTLGTIDSSGNFNAQAFTFYPNHIVTDISDNGTYPAIAITNNILCDPNAMADTKILFWDGITPNQPIREYIVNDPFIFALERTQFGLYAFGVTGIWLITFSNAPDYGMDGGVQKVYGRPTGIYSVNAASSLLYGRATASFYNNALVWGGSSGYNYAIKTFGQLDVTAPNAAINQFRTRNSDHLTYVDGQMLKGYIFAADDGALNSDPTLFAYPMSYGTPNTGVHAQTVYFQLPVKTEITRVDLVFGQPLASGDEMEVQILLDESSSEQTIGTASYTSNGAAYRVSLYPSSPQIANMQFSLDLTFTAGAVKLKQIDVYGDMMNQ